LTRSEAPLHPILVSNRSTKSWLPISVG
jgi:hypothetical protein